MITQDRENGLSHYLVARQFPNGHVEMTSLKLSHDDSLRRGGGGKRDNEAKDGMCQIALAKSQSRAKVNLRRKVQSINADRMLTLTFKENLIDIDKAWLCLKYFVKLMNARYGDAFIYVAVPEYQKRGAVHFHLAIHGYFHANSVRKLWQRATGKFGGNIDIASSKKQMSKNSWNPRNIARYLAKYITKNDSVEFNKKRYSSSRNIPVPEPVRGWLVAGSSVAIIMRDTIYSISRKSVKEIFESDEGRYPIVHMST